MVSILLISSDTSIYTRTGLPLGDVGVGGDGGGEWGEGQSWPERPYPPSRPPSPYTKKNLVDFGAAMLQE